MKAHVTGDQGFIGRHLRCRLGEQGWQITSFPEADVIFHLAALTRNDRSIDQPFKTMCSNVILSAEIFSDPRPIVYTSSAVIFSPIRTPYQISKIAADSLAQWYNDNGGDIRIVRLADVYGPGMTSGPIAAWREQYRKNGAIDVWDGTQLRHYLYIDDAVDSLIKMAQAPKGVYNVGSAVPFDITNVAHCLKVPCRMVPAPRPVAEYLPMPNLISVGTVSLEDGMEIVRQKEFM